MNSHDSARSRESSALCGRPQFDRHSHTALIAYGCRAILSLSSSQRLARPLRFQQGLKRLDDSVQWRSGGVEEGRQLTQRTAADRGGEPVVVASTWCHRVLVLKEHCRRHKVERVATAVRGVRSADAKASIRRSADQQRAGDLPCTLQRPKALRRRRGSSRRLKAAPIRRSRRTRTSCRPRALRSLRRASTWPRRWRRWAARARLPGSARRRRRARPAR